MVDRRAAGVPLEYVLGWAEFCGARIAVEPGVFVPRRRTEYLVHQVVATVHRQGGVRGRSPVVVVDLCCGSGAVGAALLEALDRVELHGVDIDPAAVCCARSSVVAGAHVYQGDLYEPLPAALRGHIDVVVANAPYVPTGDIRSLPSEARNYEARVALDGGPDGLEIVRRVAAEATRWLCPGGHLLVETSRRQAPQTIAILEGAGMASTVADSDELNATVAIGMRRS